MENKGWELKLRALLEGLETQNIDKLMTLGKVVDFRNYGKAYVNAVYEKITESKEEGEYTWNEKRVFSYDDVVRILGIEGGYLEQQAKERAK